MWLVLIAQTAGKTMIKGTISTRANVGKSRHTIDTTVKTTGA
jgi:hypothetical protein